VDKREIENERERVKDRTALSIETSSASLLLIVTFYSSSSSSRFFLRLLL
jgi:hypothetical protein